MSKQWYIVHTYSGFEKKVKESLEGRVAAFGLTDKIGQIIIPTESVVEVRGGKKSDFAADVLSRLRAGRDGYGRLHLARGALHSASHGLCRLRTDAFAADRRRSSKHSEPGYDYGRQAKAQAVFRSRRKSAYRRRALREFYWRGGRSELRSQHAEGFGHDFWPFHSGGAGFRAG